MKKWMIKVPGSTSNLGPGFDSIGLAVNRYLTIEAAPSDDWTFIYHTPGYDQLPSNEDNLMYKVIEYTARELGKPLPAIKCRLNIHCDLPLARGLGSSAAAIVAGIELAGALLDVPLTKKEKARLASLYEGHADNVAASVYGGLIVASHSEEETTVVPCGLPNMDMVAMIPPRELETAQSRSVLPESIPFARGIHASSLANVLVAALLKGDIDTAGKMMRDDLFHQPYRASIVPDLIPLTKFAKQIGISGVALSGAGPSLMCYMPKGEGAHVIKSLKRTFPAYDCQLIAPTESGSTVTVLESSLPSKK